MSKLNVLMNVTLDSVVQAPADVNEDRRDGFEQGGWATPYATMEGVGEGMANTGALLFGRRTYEHFFSYWPHQTDNPFTGFLNNVQKYVASRTLRAPLEWSNSTLLDGDIVQQISNLKAESGKDILVMGSGNLTQTLMKNHLIDRYQLMIHPLALGSGHKLFNEGGPLLKFKLVSAKPTSTGVIMAIYEPDEASA